MAGKIIASNMDEAKQTQLVEEALNEMGDNTWQK
jgi:F-type H+-transporting ATPase subunit b